MREKNKKMEAKVNMDNVGEAKNTPTKYSKKNINLTEWTNKRPNPKGGEELVFKSVNLSKFYKDSNGDYQNTDNFSQQDLYVLRDLIDEYLREATPLRIKEQ